MYALVKYIEGPLRGKKQIVSCKTITDFNPKDFSYLTKYDVLIAKDKYARANVIDLDGTFLFISVHTCID